MEHEEYYFTNGCEACYRSAYCTNCHDEVTDDLVRAPPHHLVHATINTAAQRITKI